MDELIPTRATLIKRLKNWQDQSSWQDFFDTYWKLIYNVARKSGLTDVEAQDVVQETMISVARHMPGFHYDPSVGSFKAWLLNMTRWRMRDQFRKRAPCIAYHSPPDASDTSTHPLEQIPAPTGQDLQALWEAEWKENLLKAATAKMKRRIDPRKFQIFDLYVNKGWPPAKVAKAFDIAVSQVYMVKHRVTAMLKEEVKRIEKQKT